VRLAVFLLLLMVAVSAAGVSVPGRAMALGTVTMISSPDITSSFVGSVGTVEITGVAVKAGQSDQFTIAVPGGVTLDSGQPVGAFVSVPQYNPGNTSLNAFWPGPNAGEDASVSRFRAGQGSVSFTITAAPSSTSFSGIGTVVVGLPASGVAGAAHGPVNVLVWDSDNLIPHGVVGTGTLTNNPGQQLAIATTSLPPATAGEYYSAAIATNGGGYSPYIFAVNAGTLPPGLSLPADSGTIVGTPASAGSYTFTVTVTDKTGFSASQQYTLTVNPGQTAAQVPATPSSQGAGFSDIANSWAASYITKLAKAGVVNGYPDGTFRPEQTVTRVQFAKMLLTAMGTKPDQDTSVLTGYSDYAGYASWELPWLAAAVDHHVLSGYPDGTLRPDATVTWLEGAVMIGRAIGGRAPVDFTGTAAVPAWARPYVAVDLAQARGQGLFAGGFNLAADGGEPLTRARAAAAVAVYLGL
jgi:hypothetical protein